MASVLADLFPALSATCTENPNVPALRGVPPMVPEGLRFKPPGREPELTDQEYGGDPPEALTVCE